MAHSPLYSALPCTWAIAVIGHADWLKQMMYVKILGFIAGTLMPFVPVFGGITPQQVSGYCLQAVVTQMAVQPKTSVAVMCTHPGSYITEGEACTCVGLSWTLQTLWSWSRVVQKCNPFDIEDWRSKWQVSVTPYTKFHGIRNWPSHVTGDEKWKPLLLWT